MTARLTRKIRRILMALDVAERPLSGADLGRVTCYRPGTIYPAIARLEEATWIEREDGTPTRYHLTPVGRSGAGLPAAAQGRQERPRCPHCRMPHDLTPGSLPVAACASTRQRIAAADQMHSEGDHRLCYRADCEEL